MIRPYAVGDVDQLLDVWYRASLLAHPFLSAEFLEAERGQIAEQWLPMADTSVGEIDRARDAHPVLELDVFEANEIGRRFYQAYGFRIVDRHVNEAAAQPELRLRLGETASSKE